MLFGWRCHNAIVAVALHGRGVAYQARSRSRSHGRALHVDGAQGAGELLRRGQAMYRVAQCVIDGAQPVAQRRE